MRDWMIPALLVVILLVFGSKRLPDMAQSLGQSLRILRRESGAASEDPPPPPAPVTHTTVDVAPIARVLEAPTNATPPILNERAHQER